MGMVEDLCKVVNDEQLFDFAIEHICERDHDKVHSVASMIITLYIVHDFAKNGKVEFTEQEVEDKYKELIADRVLLNLSKTGLVDVDFAENGEITYKLTQKGKEKIQHDN